ncbi:MAG: ATP-binding protein [Bacteroidales bacterium]|jgi:predicted AAA+ superfamily ATPase|nr:ATP-binding protein [Bacteroidales bacterium]
MIKRVLENTIKAKIGSGKAIILTGARQTGKTTLLSGLLRESEDVLWLDADEPDVQALFENPTSGRLKAIFAGKKILIIDEAQRIKDTGIKLKLITDHLKHIQLIATGSSSFELSNRINEPLTGRKWEYQLFPISFEEMVNHTSMLDETRLMPHRIIFGYYPEIVTNPGSEKDILKQLTDSYLYKDILMWERINKPDKLVRLLQSLAFQIGNEVSYNELANNLGIDNQTVEKYIQLLEQTFVIFRLGAFSRNLRKELKRTRKIYFYDNGIRNSLIANFNPPELRNDTGALWENFIISERIKFIRNNNIWSNSYFWRTQDQQEIDYIEERDGILHAYEIKWNPKSRAKLSKTFSSAYNTSFEVITPDNFHSFITG